MNIAVTGPSTLTPDEASAVRKDMLSSISPDDDVFSGCAFGVDSIAIAVAVELGAHLHLVIPAAHHNGDLVQQVLRSYDKVHVHYAPQGATGPSSYMLRNDELAKFAHQLLAYPRKSSFYRSGEWATINRVTKAFKPVDIRRTLITQPRRK